MYSFTDLEQINNNMFLFILKLENEHVLDFSVLDDALRDLSVLVANNECEYNHASPGYINTQEFYGEFKARLQVVKLLESTESDIAKTFMGLSQLLSDTCSIIQVNLMCNETPKIHVICEQATYQKIIPQLCIKAITSKNGKLK